MTDSTETLLRSVAAHGLMGGSASHLTEAEADSVLSEARSHGLVGLLDQAVADGRVECDEEATRRITAAAVDVAVWALHLERHLLRVHDHLDAQGVPHRFVKGASVAHRFYPHPGLRGFADIDVLVAPGSLDAAISALRADGHTRAQPDPYPGFSRRYAKSVMVRDPSWVEVDVHRLLVDGPFGLRASPEVVWRRPAGSFLLAGRSVPTLDPVAAFVHACTNTVASYDRVSWASLRDVVQIGEVVANRVPEVAELARAMTVRACLADAVRRATEELGWTPSLALAEIASWSISTRERTWLDSYRQRPTDLQRAILSASAVPGPIRKMRYLTGVGALLVGRRARRRALGSQRSGWRARRTS